MWIGDGQRIGTVEIRTDNGFPVDSISTNCGPETISP